MNTLKKVRKAPSNKTMGIEIEVCLSDENEVVYTDWLGFFYQGLDASIRTSSLRYVGREFVSQPLTHTWLHKELGKLYEKIKGDFQVNESCGIHVHVSKKWCSDKKAKEIFDVVNKFTPDQLNWVFGRGLNNYTDESWGHRYCLVNCTNKATNEFRMFKSGDCAWARYCIDCVKYMVEHAHHLTFEGLLAFRDMYKLD